MITNEEEARAFCAARCDADGMARIERFAGMLAEENARQNLVSAASLETVWQRHMADSLQLLDYAGDGVGPWLDLGSGPGLPGLVLALARPNMPIGLVESRRKRFEWLEQVKGEFGLSNCTVHGKRLEHVDSCETGVITARAFAPLDKLLRLSARFSTRSTIWLLPKGRSAAQELSEQPHATRQMFHVEQSQTDAEAAILVGKGKPAP
ncbi:16S rRNA (guanine(527)-N(7))-methyltransferase RsmG [Aurantiacibacter sp. D1-12]|uniref:16S rRNA (guanine(527)-N(7))-methyltransferase RsmG n=1 Tax=Aurantiacibacter sp. D1-12 TaxID=2993658 RepID=UPI00237CC75E|nr:16S rRNA (guanine(527)-N(7))-methyltransferase RsmG [Aurantiacibacter sp. D1-12]MDE1468138.1 16S rRNA (guanine(527)-N(7))-methyltransferase RsmG [Aurantiacibacter sp. D1-12]